MDDRSSKRGVQTQSSLEVAHAAWFEQHRPPHSLRTIAPPSWVGDGISNDWDERLIIAARDRAIFNVSAKRLARALVLLPISARRFRPNDRYYAVPSELLHVRKLGLSTDVNSLEVRSSLLSVVPEGSARNQDKTRAKREFDCEDSVEVPSRIALFLKACQSEPGPAR
jgi:hypothetical protein